jgi:hypothetical protein
MPADLFSPICNDMVGPLHLHGANGPFIWERDTHGLRSLDRKHRNFSE